MKIRMKNGRAYQGFSSGDVVTAMATAAGYEDRKIYVKNVAEQLAARENPIILRDGTPRWFLDDLVASGLATLEEPLT